MNSFSRFVVVAICVLFSVATLRAQSKPTAEVKSVNPNPVVASRSVAPVSYTVTLVDTIKGAPYEGGRWLTVTRWNGTRWVPKREWFPLRQPKVNR